MRCDSGVDSPNLEAATSPLCLPAHSTRISHQENESPSISRGAFHLRTLLNYGAPGLGAAPLTPQFAPGPNGGFQVGAFCGD